MILKSSMNYLKKRKLKLLEWLSQSPDLSVIENLEVDLKHAVHARRPKKISKPEAFCKEEWAEIL